MKEVIKKCIVSIYNPAIKEPPFLSINIDEFEVSLPAKYDDGGVEVATRLKAACAKKGYKFKFYTNSTEKGFDYDCTVYNTSNLIMTETFIMPDGRKVIVDFQNIASLLSVQKSDWKHITKTLYDQLKENK